MKRYLFPLIFCLQFNIFSNGQTYHSFPTDTAQWSILKVISYGSPNPTLWQGIYQNLKGDTVINSKVYKKIYESHEQNYFTSAQTLKCFIREDSLKKIYVKYPDSSMDFPDTSEFVLYDFNINIGDTFKTFMTDPNYDLQLSKFKLISIDSINTAQGYRKTYYFDFISYGTYSFVFNCFDTGFYWIEGVGTHLGPFYNEMFRGCYFFGVVEYYKLICYQENFNYIIGGTACHIPFGTEETDIKSLFIKTWPVPAKESISFNYSLPFDSKNACISIYDFIGKKLVSYPVPNNSQQLTISTTGLENGMYFTVIQSDENIYASDKFIINK